jgi:multiple antibiotic resistance protein
MLSFQKGKNMNISISAFFISVWLKFFFLFTPFFALSMFLSMTRGDTEAQRRKLALQIGGAVGVLCLALFFFGRVLFSLFGITVDAFRVGAGALLFLSAVSLVRAAPDAEPDRTDEDIAVVPLAMPIIVGPATIGTLLVLGAEITEPARKGLGCLALLLAVVCVVLILFAASFIERAIGKKGLNILSKITGLVLAALAAQMILTGVRQFLQ